MKKKEDLNRLMVVLAEKKCTNKWLAGKLNHDQATIFKWCTYSTTSIGGVDKHIKNIKCRY